MEIIDLDSYSNLDEYYDIDKYWDIDNYLSNIVSPVLDQGDEGDDEMINYISKTKIGSACQYWRSLGSSVAY